MVIRENYNIQNLIWNGIKNRAVDNKVVGVGDKNYNVN